MKHIRVGYATAYGKEEVVNTLRILFTQNDNDTVTITLTNEMFKDIIDMCQSRGLDISLEE